MSNFWERIREARLLRVLLFYLGASWGVLELTALMREEFQLPQWLTPVAAVLLFIGLVIIAATAWIQAHPAARKDPEAPTLWEVDLVDLKESVTRGSLPHLTWARAIIGGVFVFSLFFGFAGLYVLLTGRAPSVPGPSEAIASAAPGIAVMPFRVVGGPKVQVWREGLVDLLAPNLDGVAGLRANDPRTLLNRWRREAGDANDEPDLQVALAIAEGIGARYGILGSAVDLGSGVRITANIYDVGTGDQIGSAQVEGTTDDVLTLVDELSIQVIQQILAVSPDELPQFDVSEITTTSLIALKAYLEGEQKLRRGLWKEAVADYERAIEEDSTFALALHGLSLAYGWDEGFSQRAREYGSRAANHADRLPERAAALVRAYADLEEYRRPSIEALENLTRRYPDDVNAQTALGDAYYHIGGRAGFGFEKAAQELRRALELDPSHGPAYIHLLVDAFQWRDSTAARELLETYANLNPTSDHTIAYSWLFDLAWGDSLVRKRARSALDTMSADLVHRAVALGQYTGAYPWEPSLLAVRALTDDRHPTGWRNDGLFHLYQEHVMRGELNEGQAALRTRNSLANDYTPQTQEAVTNAWLAAWGYTADAEPLEPGPQLILYRALRAVQAANQGRWQVVEDEIQRFQNEAEERAAAGEQAAARTRTSYARILTAYTTLRRGDLDLAVAEYEKPLPNIAGWTLALFRFSLAKALLERGDAGEAEKYFLSLYDTAEAAIPAQYYLGEVYEALGDPEKAKLHYARFLRWWENPDPELQPWVASAQAALERLAGER